MKVAAQINVYNSEEYLWYVLGSIYPWVQKIIIIDGAWSPKLSPPVSTDGTEKIVRGFPDKERKITYIREPADCEREQRNKVFRFINPQNTDWLHIVDDDEVYKQKDLEKIREFLQDAKEDAYLVRSRNFVNSFHSFYRIVHRRLFRVKEGMRFTGPNKLTCSQGEYIPSKPVPGVVMFHYSYVRDPSRLELRKKVAGHRNKWQVKDDMFYRDIKLQRFEGEHPQIMRTHPCAANDPSLTKGESLAI